MWDALDTFISLEGPLRKVEVAWDSVGATPRAPTTRLIPTQFLGRMSRE